MTDGRLRRQIVDTNRFMRTTIAQLVRVYGFKSIIECDDGAAAFEQMRSEVIDIAICDAVRLRSTGWTSPGWYAARLTARTTRSRSSC